MKRISLKHSIITLFDHLHHEEPLTSEITMKVEQPWADGKTPSAIEACLGKGVQIDQIIRPAECEVVPRCRNQAIRQGDVLVMHITKDAQQRTEAFIGRVL